MGTERGEPESGDTDEDTVTDKGQVRLITPIHASPAGAGNCAGRCGNIPYATADGRGGDVYGEL